MNISCLTQLLGNNGPIISVSFEALFIKKPEQAKM